jgi:SAM-dependent methyltransferase
VVKQRLVALLRRARLLETVDRLRYHRTRWKARPKREAFAREHGAEPLPPDDLAYDAYGMLDWPVYWSSGREIATHLRAILVREVAGPGPRRVLEWGCGPARIVRHLPALLEGDGEWGIFGSDFNHETVGWCRRHIGGVTFVENRLEPPLAFPAASFDAVYCISVLTHLSEAMHRAWVGELARVLRPGGVLVASLHGDTTRDRLLPHERRRYDDGHLVVRGHLTEGRRTYVAYHPPAFVRAVLFRDLEVVGHQVTPVPSLYFQDLWIVRAPAAARAASSSSLP